MKLSTTWCYRSLNGSKVRSKSARNPARRIRIEFFYVGIVHGANDRRVFA